MLSILIPEKIPAHNKGEEAILLGICKTLEAQSIENKLYLFSESPEYDAKSYRGKAEIIRESLIPSSLLSRRKKLRHLLRSGSKHLLFLMCPPPIRRKLFKGKLWQIYMEVDLVLLAHDNAFSLVHNFLILFCKLMGKKVVMYGASILPHVYEKTLPRIFTKYCLEKLDLITLREFKSEEFLKRVGLDPSRLHVTADKAFILEPVDKDTALKLLKENNIVPDRTPLIGMTAVYYGSGVYRKGLINYKDPREKYSVYTGILARVVDFLVKELGAKVIFMPHTIGPTEANDDRMVAADILSKAEVKTGIYAINGDYTASELKGMIGCFDFFVGARTHSVIAATAMGVPSVVLSYPKDYRTYGIIGDMLGQSRWVYNIEYLQEHDLIEMIRNAWNVKDETRRELPDIIKSMKERTLLNGKLLKDMLDRNQ